MFREIRRIGQKISEQECIEVLQKAPRGVLAVFGEDGYPYALPMNHFYVNGKIYFHSSKVGHKLDAINANNKVSFCVMDNGFKKDGQWSLNIKSVVIFGTLNKIDSNSETMDVLRNLALKHYPTKESVEEVMQSSSKNVQMLELSIDHMSGKIVDES